MSGRALRLVLGCLLIGWLAACDVGGPTPPADGETANGIIQVERADDDLLILALRLDGTLLSEGVLAYGDRDRVLLPLGELSRLLELAITVTPATGVAEGWILSEDRTFRLDYGRAALNLYGERVPLPDYGIEVHADDIFVDAALLGRWLPVDLEIDFPGLLLLATPRKPLPLQQRLERERYRREVAARVAAVDHPQLELPHDLWSLPTIASSAEGPDRRRSGAGKSVHRSSLLATNDVDAPTRPSRPSSPPASAPGPEVPDRHRSRAGESVDRRSSRPATDDVSVPTFPADGETASGVIQARHADDDLLVLALRLDGTLLSEGVLAYGDRDTVLLPLGELSRLLELAITVRPATGVAEGWILSEQRTFRLDHGRGELILQGKRTPFPDHGIEVHADDIYVDAALLGRWLPVDFEIDFPGLLILATAREPLPLQQRLEREGKASRLIARRASGASYPRLDLPYQAWSVPFVDLSAEAGYGRQADGDAAGDGRYSMLATADVLYMTGEAFLAGDEQDPLRTARFRFGRVDPEGGLLGPLHATEFAFGDIVTPRLPLLAPARAERGVLVSNLPPSQPSEFDRTTLIGDLQVGWQVELYRNEALLDFQAAPLDGRYVFEDVPLLFGLNLFRLVFYGPQGQIREKIERVLVGPGLIRSGEHRYRLTMSQRSTDLFELDDTDSTDDEAQGRERYLMNYEVGLVDNLSLAAGLTSLPLDAERHYYSSLGLRGSAGPWFGTVDGVVDPGGGQAVRASAQTNLLGVNLLAGHDQFFSGFRSEDLRTSGDRVVSDTMVRADGYLVGGDLPSLGYAFGVQHEVRESGERQITLSNRLSTHFGRVFASNTLEWPLGGGAGDEDASGSLLLSGRTGPVLLRGSLNYGMAPDLEARTVGLAGDWQVSPDLIARLGVIHELDEQRDTATEASLNRNFGSFALGIGAQYATDGSFRVGLSLSVGFGRDPRSRQWTAEPRRIAGNGAASVRVFQDNNANGVFDAGDRPLENVEIVAAGYQARATTDDQGLAFITGISRHQSVPVTLAISSLEDPFLEPMRDGVEIVGRPGAVGIVDLPVLMTSELEGTVFLQDASGARELPAIDLELVDQRGEVVQRVKSAFDGFYLFQRIKPGRYTFRPDPQQLAELRLAAPPPKVVTFDGNKGLVQQFDIVLKQGADRQSP